MGPKERMNEYSNAFGFEASRRLVIGWAVGNVVECPSGALVAASRVVLQPVPLRPGANSSSGFLTHPEPQVDAPDEVLSASVFCSQENVVVKKQMMQLGRTT